MTQDQITDEWKANAEKQADETYEYLRNLKHSNTPSWMIDDVVQAAHDRVFEVVDCTRCSNCCKTVRPLLTDEDIERLSAHIGKDQEDFISEYLQANEGEHRMRTAPCPFLDDHGRCSVYEHRPESCRGFPHTAKEGFVSRTHLHTMYTRVCPAVYQIVEEIKKEL